MEPSLLTVPPHPMYSHIPQSLKGISPQNRWGSLKYHLQTICKTFCGVHSTKSCKSAPEEILTYQSSYRHPECRTCHMESGMATLKILSLK